MNFLDYIRGDRRGPEANLMERDAMRDLLLQEAMEGFDGVDGDHREALDRLSGRYRVRRRPARAVYLIAAMMVGAVFAGYWLLRSRDVVYEKSLVAAVTDSIPTPSAPIVAEEVIEELVVKPVVVAAQVEPSVAEEVEETEQVFVDLAENVASEVVVTGAVPREKSSFTGSAVMVPASAPAPQQARVDTWSTDSLRAVEEFCVDLEVPFEGCVVLEFRADRRGRPSNISVIENTSPDKKTAARQALELLRGSSVTWPRSEGDDKIRVRITR